MSSLGDLLRDESLSGLISSQIQPGAVFFIFDQNTQKDKFIVILGIDTHKIIVGSLYINSEINPNVIRTKEQKSRQFKLKCSDYPFLKYDSYIDTSYIQKRRYANLIDILVAKKGVWQGEIKERDFDYLRSIMSVSRIISTADKRDFGII